METNNGRDRRPAGVPRLVKPAELAEALNVSKRTLLNLEDRGAIRAAVRSGRVVRYNLEECLEQLKAR